MKYLDFIERRKLEARIRAKRVKTVGDTPPSPIGQKFPLGSYYGQFKKTGAKIAPERRAVIKELFIDGFPCWYCGEPAENIDHIVPVSRYGSNKVDNLAPCCKLCNRLKGPLTAIEFTFMVNNVEAFLDRRGKHFKERYMPVYKFEKIEEYTLLSPGRVPSFLEKILLWLLTKVRKSANLPL